MHVAPRAMRFYSNLPNLSASKPPSCFTSHLQFFPPSTFPLPISVLSPQSSVLIAQSSLHLTFPSSYFPTFAFPLPNSKFLSSFFPTSASVPRHSPFLSGRRRVTLPNSKFPPSFFPTSAFRLPTSSQFRLPTSSQFRLPTSSQFRLPTSSQFSLLSPVLVIHNRRRL